MAKLRKLKKVSWAPDGNLCQIRHFMPEDRHAKLGLGIDHGMQVKPSRRPHVSFASRKQRPKLCRNNLLNSANSISVRTIRWKCPAKIKLDPSWLVACGEESMEVDNQKQRELKVLEAVYLLPMDIPHSPVGVSCKDGYVPDDCNTPIIRITPVEDDEAPSDLPSGLVTLPNGANPQLPVESTCQPSGFLNSAHCVDAEQKPNVGVNLAVNTCAEADVAAAASAALTLLQKSSESGSGINVYMLMKILNNPDIVSMLLSTPLSASANPSLIPNPASGGCGGDLKTTPGVPATLQPRQLDLMPSSEALTSGPSSTREVRMVHTLIPTVANGSQLNKRLSEITKPSPITNPTSEECEDNLKTTPRVSTTLQPRQLDSMPNSEAATLAPNGTRGLGMVHSLKPSVANGSQLNKRLPSSTKPSPVTNPASGECGGDPKTTPHVSTTLQPRHCDSMRNAKAAKLDSSSTRGLKIHSLIPSLANGSQTNKTHKAPPRTAMNQVKVKPRFNSAPATPSNTKKRPAPVAKDAAYYQKLIKKHGLDNDASYFKNLIKKHRLDKHNPNLQGKVPHPRQSPHTKNSGRLGRNSKSCAYFYTPRGCKKGSKCPFQHDTTSIQAGNKIGTPNAKRMKLAES